MKWGVESCSLAKSLERINSFVLIDIVLFFRYDTRDECYAIVCDLFEEAPNNSLCQAKAYLELAQLLWKKNYDADW